jgi:nicotinamide riboside kinase
MSKNPKIVVITGAESTGKSQLTRDLAKHYGVHYFPEFARDYVEKLTIIYDFNDVENIAKKQLEQLQQAKSTSSPVVFLDTWLIITKIWFRVVFNKVPDWLNREIKINKVDLFLVCHTDIAWKKDAVRENGGEMRDILQKAYIDELKKNNYKYYIVKGLGPERLKNAIKFVDSLLP